MTAITKTYRGAPAIQYTNDGGYTTTVPLSKARVLNQAEYAAIKPKVDERKAARDRRDRINKRLNRWYYRTILREVVNIATVIPDETVDQAIKVFGPRFNFEPGSFYLREKYPELAERYRVEAARIEAEVDAELAETTK